MNIFTSILVIAAPLLLITLGALVSEYAGRLAMFIEYIINVGAFFCYAFTLWTGSAITGCVLSIMVSTLMVLILEKLASRFKANMFLISLAMGLLFASSTTLFSSVFFGTRGVLYNENLNFDSNKVKIITSVLCYIVSTLLIFVLKFTKTGLRLRITGSDKDVLKAEGLSTSFYESLSWIIASVSGAFCGCVLTLRISSYVPGISAGRGWTALAAVFLGRKHPLIVILAVISFAFAEYASTNIQNIPFFADIPSSILLSLPYIIALLLIIIVPQKKELSSK